MNFDSLVDDSAARCCSDFKLDRYRAGELDDDEAAVVRAHLEVSPICAARLASLTATRDGFMSSMPALVFPAQQPLQQRRAPRLIAAVSTLAAAAAFVAFVVVDRRAVDDDVVRTKGAGLAASVTFYVARDGVVAEASTVAPLLPGDIVRARVTAQQRGHVGVVEVEADGGVSALVPVDGRLQLVEVGETELAGAARLDDSTGTVDFVALLCVDEGGEKTGFAVLSTSEPLEGRVGKPPHQINDVIVDDDVRAGIAKDVAPAGCALEHHRFVKVTR